MDADGHTPVEPVVLVTAYAEVELADPSPLRTVEHIVVGSIVEHRIAIAVFFEVEGIQIQIVSLAEGLSPVVTLLVLITDHFVVVIEIPIVSALPDIFEICLMVRQIVQRGIAQAVGCRKDLVEVAALVEVKAHIDERATADT